MQSLVGGVVSGAVVGSGVTSDAAVVGGVVSGAAVCDAVVSGAAVGAAVEFGAANNVDIFRAVVLADVVLKGAVPVEAIFICGY